MPKITTEDREQFAEKSKPHKIAINKILAFEEAELADIKKNPENVEHRKVKLCEKMIEISQLYVAINRLSVDILSGAKNNDALNDARKIMYKAIIYLEDVVTAIVDTDFTEIKDKIDLIADIPLKDRYYLMRKLGLALKLLVDAFGDNTKWRWSFVELEGRFAIVMKNFLDWKEAIKVYFDSSSDEYDITVNYIRILTAQMDKASKEYRDRYELSTHRLDDMRFAINCTLAQRRIALLIDEPEEAEEMKKRATSWRAKVEHEQKVGAAT